MDSCSGRFLLFVFVFASTYNNVEINLTIFHVGFFVFRNGVSPKSERIWELFTLEQCFMYFIRRIDSQYIFSAIYLAIELII